MKMEWGHRARWIGLAITLVAATACSDRFPGASGPRLVELAGPLKQHGINRIFVATEKSLAGQWPEEWPQRFASGTEYLRVVVAFANRPGEGTTVNASVRTKAGPLELKRTGIAYTLQFELKGEYYIAQKIEPSLDGFPDGPYQCVVNIGGVDIALLNWSVGSQ